jgi:hypothetical protein
MLQSGTTMSRKTSWDVAQLVRNHCLIFHFRLFHPLHPLSRRQIPSTSSIPAHMFWLTRSHGPCYTAGLELLKLLPFTDVTGFKTRRKRQSRQLIQQERQPCRQPYFFRT